MAFRKKFLILIIFFILLSQFSAAQNFITRTYTVKDGLPDSQVYDVVQDSSGRMWFATQSGLCTYDGENWQVIGGKTHYIVMALDVKNRIWALPYSAFDSIKVFNSNGMIRAYPPIRTNGERRLTYSTFGISYFKQHWFLAVGTLGEGFYYLQDSKWHQVFNKTEIANNYVTKILVFNTTAYISTFDGILKFDFDSMQIEKLHFNFPASKILDILLEFENEKIQRMWVLGEKWIGYIENNRFKLLSTKIKYFWSGKKDYFFMKLSLAKDKIYYGNGIASFSLDLKIKGDSILSVNKITSDLSASSLFVDYEGNKWFATARGIVKKLKVKFKSYYQSDGLLDNEVTAISQISDKYLVFGHNYGITLINGKKKHLIKIPDANQESGIITRILDICKDSKGDLYLASFRRGIIKLNRNFSEKWFKSNEDIRYLSVKTTFDKKVLVGSEVGVFELKNKKVQRIWKNLIYDEFIRKIVQLKDSTLLFGTVNGVISLKNNIVVNYKAAIYEGNNIYSLFEQKQGPILIGTKAGLYFIKDDSLKKFYKNNFKIDRPVYFIVEDRRNNLWFGTDNGVIKWDGANEQHFTTDNGLAGNETNRAAAFVDADGNLWIGTDKGVSEYRADQLDEKIVRPHVEFNYIEDLNHNKYFPKSHLYLGENFQDLSFHYHGYSYFNENKNLYEISLVNLLDKSKQKFTTKESVLRFSSLSPGRYNFFVRFRNAKGVWSKKSAQIAFIVATPFYNRVWFYAGGIFLLFVFVLSTQHKLSELKDIREKNERAIRTSAVLETTENERKRITMDLHDGLGQFLASAKMKLEVIKHNKVLNSNELNDAVGLILQARKEIGKIINDLHPSEIEKYGLTNAVKIMCDGMNKNTSVNTECVVKNYTKIGKKNFEIMTYRIVQEALTNIIKHSNASKTEIIFDSNLSFLSITIKDNGKGFNFDGFENLSKSSMGLINMYERVNSLDGKIFINSKINYGTTIKIIIPA